MTLIWYSRQVLLREVLLCLRWWGGMMFFQRSLRETCLLHKHSVNIMMFDLWVMCINHKSFAFVKYVTGNKSLNYVAVVWQRIKLFHSYTLWLLKDPDVWINKTYIIFYVTIYNADINIVLFLYFIRTHIEIGGPLHCIFIMLYIAKMWFGLCIAWCKVILIILFQCSQLKYCSIILFP